MSGAIDFARRFDLMQQHSGEHIVSGILCGRHGCDNVGFHIGHDLVTIDFNAQLTMEDVREVEALANRYIWEDHPIDVSYPTPEVLAALPYRSKKCPHRSGPHCHLARSGLLRLLRYPRPFQRPGGAGKAPLLPEVPGGRPH